MRRGLARRRRRGGRGRSPRRCWLCCGWSARRAGATAAAAVVVAAAVISRPDSAVPLALGAEPLVGLACLGEARVCHRRRSPPARSAAWGAAADGARRGGLAAARGGDARWSWRRCSPMAACARLGRGHRRRDCRRNRRLGLWAARAADLCARSRSASLDVVPFVIADDPAGIDPFVWPRLTSVALPAALALVGAIVSLRHVCHRAGGRAGRGRAGACVAARRRRSGATRSRARCCGAAWPLAGAGIVVAGGAGAAPLAAAWVLGGHGVVLVAGGLSASIASGGGRRAARVRAALAARARRRSWRRAGDGRRRGHSRRHGTRGLGRRRRACSACGPCLVSSRRPIAAAARCSPARRRATAARAVGVSLRAARRRDVAGAASRVAAVTGRLQCLPVASPWRELPGLEYTGRLGVHVPAGRGRLEVAILSPPPLSPRMATMGRRPPGGHGSSPLAMDLPSLPPVLWPGDGRLPDAALNGVRIELPALRPTRRSRSTLALGSRAPLVAVRLRRRRRSTDVATVCAAPLPARCRSRAKPPCRSTTTPISPAAGTSRSAQRQRAVPLDRRPRGDARARRDGRAAVTVVVTARPAAGAAGPVTLSSP